MMVKLVGRRHFGDDELIVGGGMVGAFQGTVWRQVGILRWEEGWQGRVFQG